MSMSWNLSQISREIISCCVWLIPYVSQSNLECKNCVLRQHKTFTLCQNAACSSEYFLLQVDYARCSGGLYILNEQTM